MKRGIAVILGMATTTMCLTGCGTDPLKQIPLVSALTQKELTDYYTESLNYKMAVEHSAGIKKQTYELNEVSDDVKNELVLATGKVESDLAQPVWNDNMYVSKNMHQYIKAILDDKILSNTGEDYEVKESQGHYFVTVKYNISPQATGTMGNNIRYLGVNGAFEQDAYDNVMLSTTFPKWVEMALLLYNSGDVNAIDKSAQLDQSIIENILKERSSNIEKNVAGDEDTEVTLADVNENLRTPKVDITLINKLLGASVNQTAIMPELTSVYQPVSTSGSLSGYGIFPQGAFTLRDFGVNRDSLNGTLTMRYVFKRGLVDSNKLEFKNAYIVDYQLDDLTETLETKNSIIPDFITTEIKTALDRADRCISNNDLSGLMNGEVYGDTGVAVLSGFTNQYTYLQQNISSLDRVLTRDDNNNYLIKFSTAKKQGAKGGEDYGCYKYDGYAVLTQVGNNFVITDYLYDKCEMTREPQINVDDTIMKRLASLVNSGVVDPADKEEIISLIETLYKGSTERDLDIMRPCFNTDTALLSSSRKEYLVSQLCNWLVEKGVDVQSTYTGFVSEWIGGTNEQAEFITQELIDYQGKDEGLYIKNYYLVSKYGDGWVIDDNKLVETKEVYGDELNSIRQSINNQQVFNVTGAELSDDTKEIVNEIEEEQEEEENLSANKKQKDDTDTQDNQDNEDEDSEKSENSNKE